MEAMKITGEALREALGQTDLTEAAEEEIVAAATLVAEVEAAELQMLAGTMHLVQQVEVMMEI